MCKFQILYCLTPKEPNPDARLIEEYQIVGDSTSLLLNSDRGESDPGYYGLQSEVKPNNELTAQFRMEDGKIRIIS